MYAKSTRVSICATKSELVKHMLCPVIMCHIKIKCLMGKSSCMFPQLLSIHGHAPTPKFSRMGYVNTFGGKGLNSKWFVEYSFTWIHESTKVGDALDLVTHLSVVVHQQTLEDSKNLSRSR